MHNTQAISQSFVKLFCFSIYNAVHIVKNIISERIGAMLKKAGRSLKDAYCPP